MFSRPEVPDPLKRSAPDPKPFAEAVKMAQTGDVAEGSEENYHMEANDVGPFNEHIDWTLPKAASVNDLQKMNEKLQTKLINEDLAKNARASTPGINLSLQNQTEILAKKELEKIREEIKLGKLDQNVNLARNNQIAIVPTRELPILNSPNAKLSFLIPEHPVVVNPDPNPLNIQVSGSNLLNPNPALLTKPGAILQSVNGLPPRSDLLKDNLSINQLQQQQQQQQQLLNNQVIKSDSNIQMGHRLASEFPPQMLVRPEQSVDQDKLIEELQNDIIKSELAKKRDPMIGLTIPDTLRPQQVPPNLFLPNLKPQFKSGVVPVTLLTTTAHPLESFMHNVVDEMHRQEDDERERRKQLSMIDDVKKIQDSYKVDNKETLQARNGYRTILNKIQGAEENPILSSRLEGILLTTEKPLTVEDKFLKDNLMKQFGRAAINALSDNIEDRKVRRDSFIKTGSFDSRTNAEERLANSNPSLLDIVLKSKTEEEIKNKNDLKAKNILRQLVITNSSVPPISENIPRILDSKIKSAEKTNLDLKKKVLSDQLSNLRMLSNVTNQMTDRVNKVLLKRMSKTINKNQNQNQFQKPTVTNKEGGGRVINWNIENQGKQTIIIL